MIIHLENNIEIKISQELEEVTKNSTEAYALYDGIEQVMNLNIQKIIDIGDSLIILSRFINIYPSNDIKLA